MGRKPFQFQLASLFVLTAIVGISLAMGQAYDDNPLFRRVCGMLFLVGFISVWWLAALSPLRRKASRPVAKEPPRKTIVGQRKENRRRRKPSH